MSCQASQSSSSPVSYRKKRKRKREIAVNVEHSPNSHSWDNKDRSTLRADIGLIDPVPMWYWSNYYKAIEWQHKHKVALWKSYALTLQQENKYLVERLRNVCQTRMSETPVTCRNLKGTDNSEACSAERYSGMETEQETVKSIISDDMTFEMSEEMMKFFEQSIRHKLEMKKLKELKEVEEIAKEVTDLQDAHIERDREMKMLYGDGSSMIIGMETAVQLSYDKHCDMKSPKYWPNIPFNL
ncbi:UNVERIFIED_CONTAM: hypothetical protein PYX00_008894 [Menopon gallinae]|uniref:Gem-associated protein 8 n=1 Tax=Menopon gallinae TaxID=328185 RepID=A0AAW2H978_9NEOP